MRISREWLNDYINIDENNLTVDQLSHELTLLGLEIEAARRRGGDISGVVVGQILSIDPHPNADKLVVCKTDVGEGLPLQIVCGAKNMKPGDKVPTAKVGAVLPGPFEITLRKMRGVESHGMMCSSRELGLNEDHAGLMILDPSSPIGADIVQFLKLDDVVYEIEVTPNRNDWSSMIGVARELAALFKKPFITPDIKLTEDSNLAPAAKCSSVTIETSEDCPRYIGRLLFDVQIAPSPCWLAQRLNAAGVRSINNIVDITNYILLETGHPLHAFDYDKLAENRIVVRHARAGETLTTLDGLPRTLQPGMMVIADAEKPVAMAGIMGGLDSEVTDSTTRIFLESAWFNPKSIRRTARVLGMATEASQRFQRGADPVMALYALNRAAALMQELAGAKIAPGILDEYPAPLHERCITLRYARTNALLGLSLDPEHQKQCLLRLGFLLTEENDSSAAFSVPSWRHDCSMEADLIEEIARLTGYTALPASLPQVRRAETEFSPLEHRISSLRAFLADLGLNEILCMSFTSIDTARQSGLSDDMLNMVSLQNPLSENYGAMRTSLIPGMLETLAGNIRHGNRICRLFEIGPTYHPPTACVDDLPNQKTRLGVCLSGFTNDKHWGIPQRNTDFYDMKGLLETIVEFATGNSRLASLDPLVSETYRKGAAATILLNETPVGHLGLLNSSVAKKFDIDQDTCLMELDLGVVLSFDKPTIRFQPIPTFPPSLRDMAVLVNRNLPVAELLASVQNAGGGYLREVTLFDVYSGKQVPDDKKSIAFGMVFQSHETTLTDSVVQNACDAILNQLNKDYGAVLR